LAADLASAQPPPVSASCSISCTVAQIAEWSEETFPPIELAELTASNTQVTGTASLVLYANGDVKITADNSNRAELAKDANHKLVTEYRLQCDTADAATPWSDYASFLSDGLIVPHTAGDRAIEVTLSVRASNDRSRPQDAGTYTAEQTLTVCWAS
jgi:hypothetical protein